MITPEQIKELCQFLQIDQKYLLELEGVKRLLKRQHQHPYIDPETAFESALFAAIGRFTLRSNSYVSDIDYAQYWCKERCKWSATLFDELKKRYNPK